MSTAPRAPLFAMAVLDEAGLSPSQMRVLVRVARRWSEADGCYESAPSMADGCGMNVKTVRESLRVLVARGILVATERTGQTTRYDWGDPSTWRPVTLPNERVGTLPAERSTQPAGIPKKRVGGVPKKRVGTLPNERVPKGSHKGTHEGIPKSRAREADAVALPDGIDPEVWGEWEAHRREIGKTLKPTTIKHQLRELTTWTDAGHDPNAILRRSIAKGWTGLFAPDPPRAERGRAGGAGRALATATGAAGSGRSTDLDALVRH